MLCLKKRRTYSFARGASSAARRSRLHQLDAEREDSRRRNPGNQWRRMVNLRRLFGASRPREEERPRPAAMLLTVTEDTPADMLAGSMELLVQLPREHQLQSQRVTVQRSTPMMDLLVQIATAHKLAASSYSLQAIGERDLVLPHHPNTPIGALEALQVRLLPKQATLLPRKARQTNRPFEPTFRLQVHLPRNQLYVSRVSPKTILAEILQEVCREKNLDRSKYELRHPANLTEALDPELTLHDYQLQEVTLYPRQQSRPRVGSALSSQDIMALQKQEDCRRQHARHSVFGFIFKRSKGSPRSLGAEGAPAAQPQSPQQQQQQQQQPAASASASATAAAPSRPHRKRRPAPKPPGQPAARDKLVISHSRNSSDSSGYHEASVLSDNPDNGGLQPRMPETLPRRSRMQGILEGQAPRRLAQTSHASKSLGNLALAGAALGRGLSNSSLNSAGLRKKRAPPPPPPQPPQPLPSAISSQALERILDSDESLTSDMDLSKPSSEIAGSSKASSDIACQPVCPAGPDAVASVEPARVVDAEAAAGGPPVPRPRKAARSGSVEAAPSRASLASCDSSSGPDGASFGLPSLTEDEREEIAQAIDSIDEAARAHEQPEDEVFAPEQPPEAFRDEQRQGQAEARARSCAVISTIPKCDHLAPLDERQFGQPDEPDRETKKRARVARSQSEMSHFDFGPAEKQPRHLTSNGEAFTFALNPNLGQAATRRIEASIAASGKTSPMETDILLQKVSDTLSHSLSPPSPPPTPESPNVEAPNFAIPTHSTVEAAEHKSTVLAETIDATDVPCESTCNPEESTSAADKQVARRQQEDECLVASIDGGSNDSNNGNSSSNNNNNSSSSNVTLGSATSDYVSGSGEDLCIADWDYQIPAPPSEFRDHQSQLQQPTGPVESAPKPPSSETASAFRDHQSQQQQPTESVESAPKPPSSETPSAPEPSPRAVDPVDAVDAVDAVSPTPPKPVAAARPQSLDEKDQLKKARVISELESRIHGSKPVAEPAVPKHEAACAGPNIAPIENNLSNFTISTYSGNKSLDIFDQMDEQRPYSETRVLSTFATLSRGKSLKAEDSIYGSSALKSARSMERMAATTPLVQHRVDLATDRAEVFREKPVHRSKSYIVLSTNQKFQNNFNANPAEQSPNHTYDTAIDESPKFKFENSTLPKKFTSTTNFISSTQEDVPSHKQKFSQWRDNILEKHKEPSKETQLQSLQVLKSILPQLQKSQALNAKSKQTTDEASTLKTSGPLQFRFDERDSCPLTSSPSPEVQLRPKSRAQEPSKRYTYCGPPTVSLGSWSERPAVNVQIKNDTDYKLGTKGSTSGAKTIVNLASSGIDDSNDGTPSGLIRKDKDQDKKEKEKEKDEESRVDTSSVNFRELTKTFGQSEVRLRPKPFATTGRIPQQRHSEYLERPKPESVALKSNGFAESSHVSTATFGNFPNHNRNNPPVPPAKRYTSVVGITNNNNNTNISNNNVSSINNNASSGNFKFATRPATAPPKTFSEKSKESLVPKPPTMPIITGVTLKSVSARPKSGPSAIQADPRDLLLESIRNFGRDKLKSVS